MHLFLIIALFALPVLQVPTSRPAEPAGRANNEEHLNKWLGDLTSPSFRVRETATNELMNCGPWAYPALRETFDKNDDFESRRRIKQIVFEIFLTDQVGPARAFLGIQQRLGVAATRNEDPRIPSRAKSMLITDVFPGSAAEGAGVRRGDLIFMLDGSAGRGDGAPNQFTEQIGVRKPGDRIRLGVLRGGTGAVLLDGESKGFRIRDLTGLKTKLVTRADDLRVLPDTAALEVKNLGEHSSDLPVKVGDLIVALDDEPVTENGGTEQLAKWMANRSLPGAAQTVPIPVQIMPNQMTRRSGIGTMQILRGGQWLELTAKLGRWPVYLPDWLIRSRNIDSTTAASVQGTFDDWWRSNFDPRGTFSERADNDPRWRFNQVGAGE